MVAMLVARLGGLAVMAVGLAIVASVGSPAAVAIVLVGVALLGTVVLEEPAPGQAASPHHARA